MNEAAVAVMSIPNQLQPVDSTPMDMLRSAIERGASTEILEKFMALYERWQANQSRKAFDNAIAEARADLKPVSRNKTGHNSKRYADFAAIASAVDPIISKLGLSYRFRTDQAVAGLISVTCVLSHRDGHFEQTTLSAAADNSGGKNTIQSLGSTLTYLQRYSLVQMLGIAVADDDDGAASGRGGTIDADQVGELQALIEDVGGDKHEALRKGFLKKFKIEALNQLPLSELTNAKIALDAKRAGG